MEYRKELLSDVLEQGDLLRRTEPLLNLIRTFHPYYADHVENRYFAVLTQSCDLVLREGSCGARYIALAPVRSLRYLVSREFEGRLVNQEDGCAAFGSMRAKTTIEQFLQRLFNNNEQALFFYEAAHASGVADDCCALLGLPIAFKAEHYSVFLDSKIAGITDVFQAKLGWLVGQMYSRVGTPDMESTQIDLRVQQHMDGVAVWLDDGQFRKARELVEVHKRDNPGSPVDDTTLQTLLAKIPQRKAIAIDAVLAVATAQKLIPEGRSPARRNLRLALEQDGAFASVFTGAR